MTQAIKEKHRSSQFCITEVNRFLAAARPSGRGYVLTLREGIPRQQAFDTTSEAINVITKAIEHNDDVFVSLAQFSSDSSSRKKEFAERMASVWLDLDCGEGKPFKDQTDALSHLKHFTLIQGIPKPSLVINSGGGIHAYWCFTEPVLREEWQLCTDAFKDFCLSAGLKIDRAVTADAARVMRIPGSQNWKQRANPRPVSILHPLPDYDVPRIEFGDFSGALNRASASHSATCPTPTILKPITYPCLAGVSPLTLKLAGNAEDKDNIQKVVSALEQIDPDIAYPEWFQALCAIKSTGWDCAEDLARTWSAKGEKFNDTNFDKQWQATKADGGFSIRSLFYLAQKAERKSNTSNLPLLPVLGKSRYKLLSPADIKALLPLSWIVKHALPSTGLAAIFGPSGTGKSFLALDLAACISLGQDWFGIKTHPTPVVYIMLEGEGGISNRVAALEKARGKLSTDQFHVIAQPFQLTATNDVAELTEAIPKNSVVFIDTLNRAAPTADENSSKDMGQILQGAKELQACTGGLVVLIHHTGKDTTKGMRGHSSLIAALDAAIEVERTTAGRIWTIAKSKEGIDGRQVPFKLEYHALGKDADGEEFGSCSIARDMTTLLPKPEPKGSQQKQALKVLKNALSVHSQTNGGSCAPTGIASVKLEDAVLAIAATLTATPPNKRTNEARRLIKALIAGQHVKSTLDANHDAWCWIA